MSNISVSKTITVSNSKNYRFNIRSGEIPGTVYIEYEEDPVDNFTATRREVLSFEASLAKEIASAIIEIAEFERE